MFQNKKTKLIAGIIFDVIGFATPFLLDLLWAPISGYLMSKMYKGEMGKTASILVTIEELVPGLDIIPSFTIMWFYTYVIKKENDLREEEVNYIEV
ncbi:MAG: hypothetical protein WBG46_00760 [Nonlabens sp.]